MGRPTTGPWTLNILHTSAALTLERLKRLRSCRARTTAVFRAVGNLGLKDRWLRVWRGRSSDLTRPHSWWRRNCTEEAQSALYVSAVPATQPPSPGRGWRWPLRPDRCRRAASSRAAVARSVPERHERSFKSAIPSPSPTAWVRALVYVRVQSPSTSCLHEATQRNTVSFSDLRKPSLSFGPVTAAGQSGGTSESGEARANRQIQESAVRLVAHEG